MNIVEVGYEGRMAGTDGVPGGCEATASAGETGMAADATESASMHARGAEVVVGEIPDAQDLTRMLWTVRCTFSPHGLLGTYPDHETAEAAKEEHLLYVHNA